MPDLGFAAGFGTPFEAQVAYLRAKLRLPTERWDDIAARAHDKAFVVAGAGKADLLADLHDAVIKAARDGAGLAAFQRDFREIVAKRGWTGWTGEDSREGFDWRTRVIYTTNLSSSYAAGRWQQLTEPDYLRVRPYWRYLHSDHVLHPREHHLAWHGLTLRHDHPFWQTHFAPNGFGCQCRIHPVSAKEGAASERAGLGEPPKGWDVRDAKGRLPGIDKGFDYAPGAGVDGSLRQLVQDKLITYPPAVAQALRSDVNRRMAVGERASAFAERVLADRSITEPLWLGFVPAPGAVGALLDRDLSNYAVLLPADVPRHVQASHEHDGGTQRPPRVQDYEHLMQMLESPDDMRASRSSRNGLPTLVVTKRVGAEVIRAAFELRPGKASRALALISLVVKIARGG